MLLNVSVVSAAAACFLLLSSSNTLLAGQFFPTGSEDLHYRASYLGPFSAGTVIPIADVYLSRRRVVLPGETRPLMEDRLKVSSKNHPFVESLYPFRLRFRSLYSPAASTSMAFERYEKTNRNRHQVSWMDQMSGNVARFRRGKKGRAAPALPAVLREWLKPFSGFKFHKYARHKTRVNMIDQLALLSRVRMLPLTEGKEFHFPVTDGKRLLRYRVRVEARKSIRIAGQMRETWKLRFDAYRTKKGVTAPYHRAVYVWLDDTAARIPVKFESRHELGRFTIELRQ